MQALTVNRFLDGGQRRTLSSAYSLPQCSSAFSGAFLPDFAYHAMHQVFFLFQPGIYTQMAAFDDMWKRQQVNRRRLRAPAWLALQVNAFDSLCIWLIAYHGKQKVHVRADGAGIAVLFFVDFRGMVD